MTQTITILRSELEYDINHDIWRREAVGQRPEPQKENATRVMEDSDPWLTRIIEAAIQNVRRFFRSNTGTTSESDALDTGKSSWTFSFETTEKWHGDLESITSMVHMYCRYYALADWYNITDINVSNRFMKMADDSLRKIRDELLTYFVSPVMFKL